MDQAKQNGFSLFPMPPTPPARRKRATTTSTTSSLASVSSSSSSGRSVQRRSPPTSTRNHVRKSSINLVDRTQPGLELVPAPLKIRRAAEEIPPLPTSLPVFAPTTPSKTRANLSTPPKTPDNGAPQLPAIPESSPFAPLSETPLRPGHRFKPRTVAEFVELEAGTRKRASSRLSEWLDVEDGEVDRQRLSKYLASVLGGTFEIPYLESLSKESLSRETLSRESLTVLRRMSSQCEPESPAKSCGCPSDAIICHCSSSPEFEQFRSWASHKQNSSVSSTVCLLGVPRARFQASFFANMEPTIAELPSPPGLSYDAGDDESENGDWVTPLTPSNKDDVFNGSAISRSVTHYSVPSTPSTDISTPSRFQSFSRPFRPDSACRVYSDVSTPSTPSRSQSRSTEPKMGFLTSISTVSSFDFDFDIKSRRRSLREQSGSNHLRTESNESFMSEELHYEVNTATATVAAVTSSTGARPVLVTNTPKRGKAVGCSSTKSSTSSFCVPEYWHRYNAGTQTRSRSTTVGSNATTDSAAFSALLTMPMLNPKGLDKVSVKPSVLGNAFSQQQRIHSKTTSSVPSDGPLGLFDFGAAVELPATTDQSGDKAFVPRSAYTRLLSFVEETNTNSHVEAHTAANARLKAHIEETNFVSPTTKRLTFRSSVMDSWQNSFVSDFYGGVNSNRHDSGVFGRLGAVSLGTGTRTSVVSTCTRRTSANVPERNSNVVICEAGEQKGQRQNEGTFYSGCLGLSIRED